MSLSRASLLAVACAISGLLLLYPYILGQATGPAAHTALPILMLGVSAAFVTGVGYKPVNRFARLVLGPVAAWLLMLSGIAIIVLAR
jgi:predicted membrane protein